MRPAVQATDDTIEVEEGRQHFDATSHDWLVGEAIGLLHAADEAGMRGYRRAVELLGECGDATTIVRRILGDVPVEDVPLRWSLLYVLADVEAVDAIPLFRDIAAAPLPEVRRSGCETPADGEVLVRTMAVEGLGRFIRRDHEASAAADALRVVLREQREQALRVEVVKALGDRRESVADLLDDEERWILDLETVPFETLSVEIEGAHPIERRTIVPEVAERHSAPSALRTER